jgi:hypothetical protein
VKDRSLSQGQEDRLKTVFYRDLRAGAGLCHLVPDHLFARVHTRVVARGVADHTGHEIVYARRHVRRDHKKTSEQRNVTKARDTRRAATTLA